MARPKKDNEKTYGLSISVTDSTLQKLEAVKVQAGFSSKSQAVAYAVNEVYRKYYPSYSGKPTPFPGTSDEDQVRAVLKARKTAKKTMAADEENEVLLYGEHVAKNFFPKGKVIKLEGGTSTASINFHMIKDQDLKEAMSAPLLTELPMGTGVWDEDTILRRYVMRYVVPNLRVDETDPKKAKTNATNVLLAFTTGVDTGKIELEDIPVPVLKELHKNATAMGVAPELLKKVEEYFS